MTRDVGELQAILSQNAMVSHFATTGKCSLIH